MADKKIKKAFRMNRRLYKVNDPESVALLEQNASEEEIENLESRGLISKGFGVKAKSAPKAKPAAPNSGGDQLPSGFPGRMALIKAGYDTLEKVKAASDSDLEAVPSLGDGMVAKIREALG